MAQKLIEIAIEIPRTEEHSNTLEAPAVPRATPAQPNLFTWRTAARWLLIALVLAVVGWWLDAMMRQALDPRSSACRTLRFR